MYLSRLGDGLSEHIKKAGRDLFWAGRVRIQRGNIREVNAEVEDGAILGVRLMREGKAVLGVCQCAAAVDLGVCIHIWATILQSERMSYLGGSFQDGLPEVLASVHGAISGDARESGTWPAAFHAMRSPFMPAPVRRERDPIPTGREIYYVINPDRALTGGGLSLQLQARDRKKDGSYSKNRSLTFFRSQLEEIPDPADREILTMLAGVPNADQFVSELLPSEYSLLGPAGRQVAKLACQTGRCHLVVPGPEPLQWAGDEPWKFRMQVGKNAKFWVIEGAIGSGDVRIPLHDLKKAMGGLFVTSRQIGPLDLGGSQSWFDMLRRNRELTMPIGGAADLLAQVMSRDDHPPVDWHPELEFEQTHPKPLPWFLLRADPKQGLRAPTPENHMIGDLRFIYDGVTFRGGQPGKGVYMAARRSYIHRDLAEEKAATQEIENLRLKAATWFQNGEMLHGWDVTRKRLPEVVSHLTRLGWKVEVEGKQFRQSTHFEVTLTSQIDWFDLEGGLEFGSEIVRLPELLKAIRRGENMVPLSDGTFGIVPEDVMEKFGAMVRMAHTEDGHVRFRRNQTGLLDALLLDRPEITFDDAFAQARDQLNSFHRVDSFTQPAGFVGTLREYQKEGVAWMQFLARMGLGGCLADDMGVGKTPQMLALLETRRLLRPDVPPSLVVVPRSLVYNWMQEAARFTPQLKILDHTGADRETQWDRMQEYDLVISTYGTLRRDAVEFRHFDFDYIILDEAQAIKNPQSESAKAARLLRGQHRMVLSGTPIENHLGELWSLVEFLNPGMLGASVFQTSGASLRNPDEDTRRTLARAIRPFVLRRTKEQVAKELPPKVENTVYCELEGDQKKLYNELRDHYRQTLLGKIEKQGIGRVKLQILEALLRLRQAACHPGLIDKTRVGEPSAKLETLLDHIQSVAEEGHKALIFSQFTSLLSIVCGRLTEAGIRYEYLDGRTRDRQKRVERFQGDPECPVFVISLKAGGVGLNLTAADYVFLLDPWWNPAVEAQAVDRAHRIGQQRQVFTYRLIARGTVEEKVLQLQAHKRELAGAIINADEGMVKSLQREDLEILLS
jgi:superfamily II DNA or RNA helicase